MKIDQEYLKGLLLACQASDKPTFDIEDLHARSFDYNEPRFEFHMRLLSDQRLIEDDGGYPGIGLAKSVDGYLSWSVLPLRLTAEGHQFIEALEDKEVFAKLKHGFANASLATLKEVAPKLLEAVAEQKIKKVLGLD